jgi:asparagine synthase (glutamine-hydrolysing)
VGVLIHASLDTGAQPLVSDDDNLILCVNGEIYNHKQLRANLKNKYEFKTHSDCEVIMHMVRLDDDHVKLYD